MITDDYTSDYETQLEKNKTSTMSAKRMRSLATEIYKTINNLNPPFMKEIFTPKVDPKVRPNDIIVKRHNTTKYGTKSLTTLGPQIWNSLPENIKSVMKMYTDDTYRHITTEEDRQALQQDLNALQTWAQFHGSARNRR